MSCENNMCSTIVNNISVKRKPNLFALKVKEVREKTGLIGEPLFFEAQRQYREEKGLPVHSSNRKLNNKNSSTSRKATKKGSRKASKKGSRKASKKGSRKASKKGSRKASKK